MDGWMESLTDHRWNSFHPLLFIPGVCFKWHVGQRHLLDKRLAQAKNTYIGAIINGRYFLARCNLMAGQIHSGKIVENIDGCPKDEEYMRAEYAMFKLSAIKRMREAYFAKRDLMTEFKLTEKDIHEIESDYYNGKIIREDWDSIYDPNAKISELSKKKDAGFVNQSKN